ncbi:MAG: aldo/keto reductase [Planctomycetes bacterium]|nr:aldo/keto reductase [Planctomycetota bacterium]
MQHTQLGRTGLSVSRLCLGTMNFGPETTAVDSHAILDKSLELGIDFLDTANVYGAKRGEGVTERILGDWFAAGPAKRDRVVIATKVFGTMGDGANDRGCSAFHIRAACEESLKRLRTDRIDLYQMHHIDRSTPWDELWQAMDQLVTQGKVLYVGSSNFAGWHIATACQTAARRGSLGLVSEQSKYSLACRTVELEVLPACRHYGVGVIPWSPLDGGLLGGVLGSDAGKRRSSDHMKKRIEALRPQLTRWEALCTKLGERPADVALAWLLRNPAVTAPIIGPRTMEQLTQGLRALELTLDTETVAEIDRIWPGPGNVAPEAYAW